jgi:A/G-specific adenine glycosylase
MELPGIGRNTACSITAFAFNKPVAFIETNIRSAFIHFFFNDRVDVHDREILPLVEKALDEKNPRQWYSALMDYGVMLKKTHPNPSRKSAHHQRQSKFAGSNRQVRGMIIKLLTESPQLSEEEVIKKLRVFSARIKENFVQLIKEGLIKKKGQKFMIA